jgi:transposase-like protein
VRIGKRRVVVPVLVSLGVKADGKRVVLDMRLAGEESTASWGEVVASLVRRNLGMPKLALIDGNPGLHDALLRQWPGLAIQCCPTYR